MWCSRCRQRFTGVLLSTGESLWFAQESYRGYLSAHLGAQIFRPCENSGHFLQCGFVMFYRVWGIDIVDRRGQFSCSKQIGCLGQEDITKLSMRSCHPCCNEQTIGCCTAPVEILLTSWRQWHFQKAGARSSGPRICPVRRCPLELQSSENCVTSSGVNSR